MEVNKTIPRDSFFLRKLNTPSFLLVDAKRVSSFRLLAFEDGALRFLLNTEGSISLRQQMVREMRVFQKNTLYRYCTACTAMKIH